MIIYVYVADGKAFATTEELKKYYSSSVYHSYHDVEDERDFIHNRLATEWGVDAMCEMLYERDITEYHLKFCLDYDNFRKEYAEEEYEVWREDNVQVLPVDISLTI